MLAKRNVNHMNSHAVGVSVSSAVKYVGAVLISTVEIRCCNTTNIDKEKRESYFGCENKDDRFKHGNKFWQQESFKT